MKSVQHGDTLSPILSLLHLKRYSVEYDIVSMLVSISTGEHLNNLRLADDMQFANNEEELTGRLNKSYKDGSKGLCKEKKFQKSEITMGRWWVQVSLGIFFWKSSQNSSKQVLILWSSIPCICILSVYTLLKVVSYYDWSVLSMSVMGFKKKYGWGAGMGGWVGGWDELYQSLFWILLIFLTLQSP